PHQTLATPETRAGLKPLLSTLVAAHRERFGTVDDLLVGLQLTHSGRYSRPTAAGPRPRIAYHHPLLDARLGIHPENNGAVISDDELERLLDKYVAAAGLAFEAGFRFVDLKACHGYLVHELLSGHARPGRFGGDFEGRTRFLRDLVGRVRAAWPELLVGVRLSAFDTVPYQPGTNAGEPAAHDQLLPYRYAFGVDPQKPTRGDLAETIRLLTVLQAAGVAVVNLSAGSPYYNPHLQRPALFPPSDGYQPPEDPLAGVVRQIIATRDCRAAVPGLLMVGTAYSYLQEFLPHVAQAVVRAGWADYIGLGRMVLSYPELPADVLAGQQLARKQFCRTFSDCTTGPRLGMMSGCYPLDPYYKAQPQAALLKAAKRPATDPPSA
ncbi:MAG: NADH:flavin oxidoreductase, partial [Pirellulales bacterium]